MHRTRWIKAVTGGLVLCLTLSVCGFYGTCAGVRDRVIRLHILANSDSTADQHLKMQVRDAVTTAAAGWLDGAQDTEKALTLAREHLPVIQQVAQRTVHEAGYRYPVTVTLDKTYFTTRQYDTITLPAGTYQAVRIEIGEAKGQNWWCVVFPPLCFGSAIREDPMSEVLTGDQQALVSSGEYRVRFAVLEWLEDLFSWFR